MAAFRQYMKKHYSLCTSIDALILYEVMWRVTVRQDRNSDVLRRSFDELSQNHRIFSVTCILI